MSNQDQLAEDLCAAFALGASTWHVENYTWASTVMFYMAAIHLVESKPFEEEEVQLKVTCFLQEKLYEATSKLMEPATKRLDEVLKPVIDKIEDRR